MNFIKNQTYKITFPNNDTIVAKYIEDIRYPSSGMPPDYIFEGVSGDFPKHETMYPQFPLPEFLVPQTSFVALDEGESFEVAVAVDLEALLEEYNNCEATVKDSVRAEEIMKEIWDNKDLAYRDEIQKALIDRLAKLQAVGLA